MKNTTQAYSRSRVRQFSVGIIAAASLTALLPTDALAGCRGWDVACKVREAANRARDAARRAVDEARRKADEAQAQTEAAARRADDEKKRLADETKAAADQLAREGKRLEEEAKALANKLLEQAMKEGLDLAFGQLKAVGLDVLADTKQFANPDLWLREITQVVMSDMAGEKVADQGAKAVSYIKNQLGNFSEAAPFGDGPVGKQLQAEVEKTYKKALQNTSAAGEKGLDYLNPLNNPILPSSDDFNVAKAMYSFDLPNFTRFSYSTDLQVKPIDVTVDAKDLPFLLKGNISTTFPLIWGNNDGATSIFVNAVDDKKFNFTIAAMAGIKSREVENTTDDRSVSYKDAIKFDVSCSIVNIGMCQLIKITNEHKVELQRKADGKLTEKIRQAVGSVITVVGYMQRLSLIQSNSADALVSVLRQINSSIDQPLAVVDKLDQIVFVADDTVDRALKRHSDLGAITYLYAIITAIPDLKSESKGKNLKRTFSLTDLEGADVAEIWEWYNADAANHIFKPGFAYIGNNPLADVIGFKIGKSIATEATFKLSNLDPVGPDGKTPVKGEDGKDLKADKNSVSASVSVATASNFGVFLPLKSVVMKNFSMIDQKFRNSGVTDQVLKVASNSKGSFGDRVGLGASKQWANPTEMQELEGALQLKDSLNLATYVAISGN